MSHAITNNNHPCQKIKKTNRGLTPIKRRLLFRANTPKEKARRLRWAIGLYFAMCVSLSVLLFTWTLTTFHNHNNAAAVSGTAQSLGDAAAGRRENPFHRVSMSGSRSLWKADDHTTQQQQQPPPPQWTPDNTNNHVDMISIPEELRIPDDEPVVQVINTRYVPFIILVFAFFFFHIIIYDSMPSLLLFMFSSTYLSIIQTMQFKMMTDSCKINQHSSNWAWPGWNSSVRSVCRPCNNNPRRTFCGLYEWIPN